MTSKERMVAALEGRKPDRLPVTTHHVMPYFLNQRLDGISADEFFARFGLDAIRWFMAFQPDAAQGARYDVIEHGGGDASSTVISPRIFDEFVAPYDAALTELAHAAGQRVVYHTCGGMMPLLERLADLGVDALETFTPRGLGGDTNLAEAKRRIGERVCMIGGFDQLHSFTGCIQDAQRFLAQNLFHLPPFAAWTPADWEARGEEVRELVDCGLGWDITDFGAGDYVRFCAHLRLGTPPRKTADAAAKG